MYRTWVECTSLFQQGVRQLKVGELLHNGNFGLFEAMSAIEIMDPKMDSGIICNRNLQHQLSFQSALEKSLIKLDDFSNDEIIAIMDETLASFVTWLDGYSLAQTIFLNFYVQQPNEICNEVLRTFCYLVHNLVDVVKEIINKASIYEEEDFQPSNYGFNLAEPINSTMLNLLKEQEEQLISTTKTNNISLTNTELSNINGIIARLKFCQILYKILLNFSSFSEKNSSSVINDTKKLASKLSEFITDIRSTINFESNFSLKLFEPLFEQRSLPPSFPKSIELRKCVEAYNYFENLASNLINICKFNTQCQYNDFLNFFVDYSKATPCLLSRSMLYIMHFNSKLRLVDSIQNRTRDEQIYNFITPPLNIFALSHDSEVLSFVNNYLFRCYHVFTILIQICGHNRARQRDKLAKILEDFSTIRKEAESIDVFLQCAFKRGDLLKIVKPCFSTWILYYILKVMIMYILSGFELELYSTHEYCYIFWYLYEYLFTWMIGTTNRLHCLILENDSMYDVRKSKRSKKMKVRKFAFQQEITFMQSLQQLCGGYYKAILEFQRSEMLVKPALWFDNEKTRFEHRFKSFKNLEAPPAVSYQEFLYISNTMSIRTSNKIPQPNFLLESINHFRQARNYLEILSQKSVEIQNLITVSKTNFIVLKLIKSGHKKDNSSLKFDFQLNKNFPIIKI